MKMKMKKKPTTLLIILMITIHAGILAQNSFSLKSPDKRIKAEISISENTSYSVFFEGQQIIFPSTISMLLEGKKSFGLNPKVKKSNLIEINETIIPVVAEKRSKVIDHCNQLTLNFKGNYSLVFRAYNDGIAYRWIINKKGEIIVKNEISTFNLSASDSVYFPEEESFLTHSERKYPLLAIKDITNQQMSCMPVLVKRTDNIRIAITEADLLDYPGLYLKGNAGGNPMFTGLFPPYPLEEKQIRDRTIMVEKAADFIAKTTGPRAFPWRVMIITDNDGALIESDMVYRLGSPNRLENTEWIKPGKVAWDWFNALNIYGVDFESGLNTDTYKYYIDFAANYNIPYIILDEGWSDTEDLFSINPDIDLPELFRYARNKNVGIILWVVWNTLDNQLDEALTKFEEWGAKGIKVDFMQRDDQKMVNYYEKIAIEAAKHHLMVDFHGSYKPTGLRRAYPNVLTREGVHGLENNKWAESVTPEHNVTLPFTRMLAGPMDYTPGAMINSTAKQFSPVWDRPMSQGTRCHQLAMYVIYESPLQMLADSPSNYYKELESMDFLKQVPVTWDETIVLEAKIGDYILMARKNGNKWLLGGMTDWTSRKFELDLSVLGDDFHQISIWEDGANADKNPQDLKFSTYTIDQNQKVEINMASGGGWVAVIE